MSLAYKICADEQLARVTGEGHADFDAFIGVMNGIAADPAFSPNLDVIADFSRIDYTPSFREIKKIAAEFENVRSTLPPRVGIVVKDKVQLRLGRFAAMVAGLLKFDLSVFEDLKEANHWVERRRSHRMQDVRAKILELWSEPQLSTVATVTEEGKPWARYVLTTASEDLVFRFATYRESRKAEQIETNPEVHLLAGAATMDSAEHWVQVSGRAELSGAPEDRRLAWHDTLAPFFEGPEDPGYIAVVVRPYRIEYMEMGFSRPELWESLSPDIILPIHPVDPWAADSSGQRMGGPLVDEEKLSSFGERITRLIRGESLTQAEARECWRQIIADEQPELQQGAFMAALAAKGETSAEIAGSFEAIYEHDTNKVDLQHLNPLVENCGTGRDTLKTFNVSTAASIIAAACGVHIARHGARAVTSKFGTVDVLEEVGVDVDCDVETVKRSVERAGIGLFNGMSAEVHPRALFRILSQIRFGSILHVAGSLANPARPTRAVRGVYSPEMLEPTARTMRAIGYERALVCYGWNADQTAGMDELSTMGETEVAELTSSGAIERHRLAPEDLGISRATGDQLDTAADVTGAARLMVEALVERGAPARRDIACLNAAAVLYVAGMADDLSAGLATAREVVGTGMALDKLRDWVANQNRSPEVGLARLDVVLADG